MTNEEMLGVAEIVERATNRFNEQNARFRERSSAYDRLIADMNADHERKLAEHRASFGARTSADAKIIEGLRAAADEQVLSASKVAYVLRCAGETPVQAAQRVVKERDGLLTQVQDQRAEIERLRNDERKAYQDGEALRAEVERLKTTARWVRRTRNPQKWATVGAVASVRGYLVRIDDKTETLWESTDCEPCDPPGSTHAEPDLTQLHAKGKEAWSDVPNATQWVEDMRGNTEASHDTPAGKEAAESVIRDFRSGDSEVSITGLFDDTKITVRREPDQDHGSRIVIDAMGEANIYLTESGARQMATALIGLCDVRKVPQ